MLSSVIGLLGIATSVSAAGSFTKWVAPGPGDIRGPCPGLNTLANHNFINHNGRNMTIPHLITGLSAGLNVAPDFSTAIGASGVLSSKNPDAGMFDLHDIAQHNFPIEHDASLSRKDKYFGNNIVFNQRIFDNVMSYYGDSEYTSIPAAARARYSRVKNSVKNNPKVLYGPREFTFSSGETGLYLQTMGNDTISGVTKVEYVRYLFEKEKLPYEIGWRRNPQPITLASLANMNNALFLANPQRDQEGFIVTADALGDILAGSKGINDILAGLKNGPGKRATFH